MVILIASDQSKIRRGLADRLRESTGHRVLTAASIPEMEAVPQAEGALDLIFFSPVFSIAGKAARARLREQFPDMQTVALEDGMTLDNILVLIAQWLPEEDASAATEDSAARSPDSGSKEDSLGDYDLRTLLRSTERTLIYKAVQRSVRREVALERLRPELASDPEACRDFRRMVRSRALVSHPSIAAVYEAQEVDDVIFYTRELVRGKNLVELAAEGTHFPQTVLLQMLHTAGEAFSWMKEHDIPHEEVKPMHLFLGQAGTPRVANIAQPDPAGVDDSRKAMEALADACLRLIDSGAGPCRELSHVLGLMKSGKHQAMTGWKQLAREARMAFQRISEVNNSLLPESRERILARQKLRQKQAVLSILAILLIAAAWWGISSWQQYNRAKVRDVAGKVLIPAGEFIFRSGQKQVLPGFDIDRYEVTLAEYSNFLDALPHGETSRFDHPDQPAGKTSHLPRDWAEISAAARTAGHWKGHPITLNAPVFNVDWWDAWAYARWKQRRLPTAEEWEKAARGTNGNLWPWGSGADLKAANTGSDYSDQPTAGGNKDGHTWWNDVDAMPGDVSAFGVHGLGGNVAEWTDTLVPEPELPDVMVPVFCGGDFHQTVSVPLNAAPRAAKSPLDAQPFLGFRTVSPPIAP